MIALVQRVSEASVAVDGQVVGTIGRGLLVLLGIHQTDSEAEAVWLARKCAALRIFPDEEGRMNRSVLDIGGEALVVSQFTLYGDARKGNRPSFVESAPPEVAEPLYEAFMDALERETGTRPERGIFGAMMDVHLVNQGPVTLIVERRRD
jgi:D-tyrosyl-tRNA(Tyr) deacylase